jgi:hypothetical protein
MSKPSTARKPFSVKLTTQERATLRAGAKALSESQGQCMRAGGLERAARGLLPTAEAIRAIPLVGQPQAISWGDGSKPPRAHEYACAYCPARFPSEFDADAHIETAHPETP